MNQIAHFINKFSFSRKLAITFFICALVTFIVIDVILHILYATVVTSTNSDSIFDTQAFSQFSNSEILSSTSSYIQSGVDIYEQIITQTYTAYQHFINKPDLYKSRLSRGINPKLCQNINRPRYDSPCIYFYRDNATFYNQPFLDKIISSSASSHYPNMLKRINIIYQSNTDPGDISIRTVPATKDFYVPDIESITKRMVNLQTGFIEATDWYYDQLSKSKNSTKLISLRLLVPNTSNYKMLIQVQVIQLILDQALTNIYSYPSTKTILIKTFENNTKFSIMGQVTPLTSKINLNQFLHDGTKHVTIGGHNFLVTTKLMYDGNNQLHQQDQKDDYIGFGINKLIIFLNTTQSRLPNIVYSKFLQKEYSLLIYILYGWTFIVLLVLFSIGVVIGDIIFSYFSLIRKKCKQYLQNPQQLKEIKLQIKATFKNEKNQRQLYQNIVSIMQGIQDKKKQNRKNYKICYDEYPLNYLGLGFQDRMRINDYHKFQQIANLIKQRQPFIK